MAETKVEEADVDQQDPANAALTSSMSAPSVNAPIVKLRAPPPSMTVRARRRREEAVRRLVADIQTKSSDQKELDVAAQQETHEYIVASTVATALEKGLDRDLHAELVQEAKDNAGRIGQICHDHADVFLDSVAQVAALAGPSADLGDDLQEAQDELQLQTAGPMHDASMLLSQSRQSYSKARILQIMVNACQRVALLQERARKQAAAGRPRAALDAVEEARSALSAPIETLFYVNASDKALWREATRAARGDNEERKVNESTGATATSGSSHKHKIVNLEQTPFGKRAAVVLPKIENEVIMTARRGLNRWFLALRSGGEGAKAGRAVLRQCGYSLAVGPGHLSLGGFLPSSYVWRARTTDNLIARVDQNGKVARAVRQGYWFDRDAQKEAERVETCSREGMERRSEVLATAFGWYRCWGDDDTGSNSHLWVDPAEYMAELDISRSSSMSGSRHGLSGSRHGLSGSRHGLRGSRHGKGRSLGFRAATSSKSQAFQDMTSTLGAVGTAAQKAVKRSSKWNDLLCPPVLMESSASKEEYEMLMALPESVHPVRRAEISFSLLGRSEEFVEYYEQNRFGDMVIAGGDGGKDEKKSYLSSLTGDDVSVGTDRIFFAKTLPHLCASVIGFTAVEAALELGNFTDEAGETNGNKTAGVGSKSSSVGAMNAGRFRESSERYERALVAELGTVLRTRAKRANMAELVRSSNLMAAFRAALRLVHPSSANRRHDKELLSLNVDMLMAALKICQDEQLKCTAAIIHGDEKVPMLVAESPAANVSSSSTTGKNKTTGVPDPEVIGLPFGLSTMKQEPKKADLEFQEQARTSYNRAQMDEAFTFSSSVPAVVRAVHARAIACAAFVLSQEELGQKFPEKKSASAAAGYVLDCLEECINVAAIGLKDSDNVVEEGSVEKAVQVMANISAFQRCLGRLVGTLLRGMCHIGLIREDEVEATFQYAEKTLKAADKACDGQVGSTYSLVYEICRNRIDSHINYALENFNWVAKSARDMPNAYCEGLIGYLKSVFASLGPMDEGSRAGLHFSCCGHVSERLVKLLSGKPGDTTTMDDSGMPPITRIDAFGIKNLSLDCAEFERFADTTGIPQLRDCFNEFSVLTNIMLDKDLPALLLPENAAARRRKYPILSLDKIANILEKYQVPGLGDKLMGGSRSGDILFLDKKEVQNLLKVVRSQIIS